jgi:hypothetical protein
MSSQSPNSLPTQHGQDAHADPAPAKIEKGSSLGRDAWYRLKKNHLAMGSLWFFLAVVLLCFFLPLVPGIPDPNVTHPDLQSLPAFSSATSIEVIKCFTSSAAIISDATFFPAFFTGAASPSRSVSSRPSSRSRSEWSTAQSPALSAAARRGPDAHRGHPLRPPLYDHRDHPNDVFRK